jgi:hypothetical protein
MSVVTLDDINGNVVLLFRIVVNCVLFEQESETIGAATMTGREKYQGPVVQNFLRP